MGRDKEDPRKLSQEPWAAHWLSEIVGEPVPGKMAGLIAKLQDALDEKGGPPSSGKSTESSS